MNNYEEIFADTIGVFSPSGIWIRNNNLMVGISYMYIEKIGDDGLFNFESESDEYEACAYANIESFFEYECLEFCFTLDKALQGNFITWKEFCDRIDNKKSFDDVISI